MRLVLARLCKPGGAHDEVTWPAAGPLGGVGGVTEPPFLQRHALPEPLHLPRVWAAKVAAIHIDGEAPAAPRLKNWHFRQYEHLRRRKVDRDCWCRRKRGLPTNILRIEVQESARQNSDSLFQLIGRLALSDITPRHECIEEAVIKIRAVKQTLPGRGVQGKPHARVQVEVDLYAVQVPNTRRRQLRPRPEAEVRRAEQPVQIQHSRAARRRLLPIAGNGAVGRLLRATPLAGRQLGNRRQHELQRQRGRRRPSRSGAQRKPEAVHAVEFQQQVRQADLKVQAALE
mmetsp:Transcript_49676/g.142116  ORF Transcript_49676/g.142116 Transcript_49676/m.142116 type:complete len:286 (+) Transcript_49676:207-1064(+)